MPSSDGQRRGREIVDECLLGEQQWHGTGRGMDGERQGRDTRRTVGLAGRQVARIAGAGGEEHCRSGAEMVEDAPSGQHRERTAALCRARRLVEVNDDVARGGRDSGLDGDQPVDVAADQGELRRRRG